MREYFVRFYARNPGGAYDPAHLPEFDMERETNLVIPAVGDVVCSWSKSSSDPEGRTTYYTVLTRQFLYENDAIFVSIETEETRTAPLP